MPKASPSLRIFRNLIVRNADTGELDVSGVVSRECYETWMKQKKIKEENESVAKRFSRTLLNHVSGTDGRSPFEEEEEAAILVLLRKRQPWPCFPPELSHFGQRYRALGYHERLAKDSSAIMASPAFRAEAVALNIQDILQALDSEESASFVRTRCEYIVDNMDYNEFMDGEGEERENVLEMMRYTFMERTGRIKQIITTHAQALCTKYDTGIVCIWNFAAAARAARILAENQASKEMPGDLVFHSQSFNSRNDVLRVLVALGAACTRPGADFVIKARELGTKAELFDVIFSMDEESFLLVIRATPSS